MHIAAAVIAREAAKMKEKNGNKGDGSTDADAESDVRVRAETSTHLRAQDPESSSAPGSSFPLSFSFSELEENVRRCTDQVNVEDIEAELPPPTECLFQIALLKYFKERDPAFEDI